MKQRSFFLLILIFTLALFCLKEASFSYYPQTGRHVITVTVELKGSYQEGIEEIITNPLEEELLTLVGLRSLHSVSEDEKASLSLQFEDTVDLDEAYLLIRDRVERSYASFPKQTQKPRILKSGNDSDPVFILMMSQGGECDEEELKKIFRSVPGTGRVDVGGAPRKDAVLLTQADLMQNRGMSEDFLVKTVSDWNRIISTPLRQGYPLTADLRFKTLEDFSRPELPGGGHLGDLIQTEWRDSPVPSIARVNGEDKILVWVRQAGDANTIRLCRDLRMLQERLPGAEILYDRGGMIEKALREAGLAVLIGIIAVFIVTSLFLGNFMNALLLSLNIPFSLAVSMAVLTLFGREIDMMVLSGAAVGTGLVIDGGVIFLEMGKKDAAKPVFYSLISTIIVFSSLIFASLAIREMFGGIIWAITLILLSSLFYIFILLPDNSKVPRRENSLFAALPIESVFDHIGKNRISYGTGIIILTFFSLLAASRLRIQQELILNDQSLSFSVEYPAGTSRETVVEDLAPLEKVLCTWDELLFFSSDFRTEKGVFQLRLKDGFSQSSEQLQSRIREEGASLRGILFFQEKEKARSYDLSLLCHDREKLYTQSEQFISRLQSRRAGDVIMHYKKRQPLLELILKGNSLSLFSLSPALVFRQVSSALNHPVRLKWLPPISPWPGQESYDVRIFPKGSDSPDLSELLQMAVLSSEGSSHLLAEFAAVGESRNFGRIYHFDGLRGVSLSLLIPERNKRESGAIIESLQREHPLPEGIRILHGQKQAERIKSLRSLISCISLSMVLVFFLLIYLFESLRVSLFLFIQIPLALIFPLCALSLIGVPLSPPVFFGLILVIGISVNNGIILFSGSEDVFSQTETVASFHRHAGSLITSLVTTLAGILPLLFSGSAGQSSLSGLALTICLGLMSSLIITVIITALFMHN
ncbi:MAG: hypothetical protein B6241_05345 [Spirochaetaceae bacterium 4572_59]|nr:MAG: hypothetical protein B6241_05345 [Spirochaetaceae bacterium 4572_59]